MRAWIDGYASWNPGPELAPILADHRGALSACLSASGGYLEAGDYAAIADLYRRAERAIVAFRSRWRQLDTPAEVASKELDQESGL